MISTSEIVSSQQFLSWIKTLRDEGRDIYKKWFQCHFCATGAEILRYITRQSIVLLFNKDKQWTVYAGQL